MDEMGNMRWCNTDGRIVYPSTRVGSPEQHYSHWLPAPQVVVAPQPPPLTMQMAAQVCGAGHALSQQHTHVHYLQPAPAALLAQNQISMNEKERPAWFTWTLGGNCVFVEGSWDKWTNRKNMERAGSAYHLCVFLKPGVYRYRFIVDQEPRYNPHFPSETDAKGNTVNILVVDRVHQHPRPPAVIPVQNQTLLIQKAAPVWLTWTLGGNCVSIEGSWDRWTNRQSMERAGNDYYLRCFLAPGVYRYRFLVDGEPRFNPGFPSEIDANGNTVNILVLDVQNWLPASQAVLATQPGTQVVLSSVCGLWGGAQVHQPPRAVAVLPVQNQASSSQKGQMAWFTWTLGGVCVFVEGSWDEWTMRQQLRMVGCDHHICFFLVPGVYRYRFVVDGEPRFNPDLPSETDDKGNVVNILVINGNALDANREILMIDHVDGIEAVPLMDFLREEEPVVPFHFNAGAIVGNIDAEMTMYKCTSIGMKLLNGFFAHANKFYQRGLSWGGEFEENDMVVVDGVLCKIRKRPQHHLTYANLKLDLSKLKQNLLSKFGRDGRFPPYFAHLFELLDNPCIDFDRSEDSKVRYLKKVMNHAALATPSRRMLALRSVGLFLQNLNSNELKFFDNIFSTLLVKNPMEPTWIDVARSDRLLDLVYQSYIRVKPNENGSPTALNMISFLQHVFVHVSEKTSESNNEQILQTYTELDQIIAYYFKEFLAMLLVIIGEACDQHPLLKATWECYSSGTQLFEQR